MRGLFRSLLVVLAASLILSSGEAAVRQASSVAPAAGEDPRLAIQREAASLLKQAARPGNTRDQAQRALRDAAQRLKALAADPDPPKVSNATAAHRLDPALRDELRRAASVLAAGARDTEHAGTPDTSRVLALLERVRAQLEGEIALGLTFQGSYSQSKPKEPAYGGHASAMGPPPVNGPSPDDAALSAGSPVTFEEAGHLPARTYGGGPTKDHILESGGSGVALIDYDGDGRLDIYVITAAELTPTRERIRIGTSSIATSEDGNSPTSRKRLEWTRRRGVTGLRWRRRRRWTPRSIRDELGPQLPVPQPRRRQVRRDRRQGGCKRRRLEHRLHVFRRRRRRRPGSVCRALCRNDVGRGRARQADAGLARRPPHHGGTSRPSRRGRFVLREPGGRTLQRGLWADGLADPARAYGFGVIATDYDDDGFVNLFVANDSNPNFLYRNLGNGRFESVGLAAGVALNGEARAQAGMGADAGDYDGDSRIDFVLTAFAHDRNTLYHNIDGRQFEDVSESAGLAAPTFGPMGWGTAFLDADLDGKLDLFFANGHIFADIDNYPQLGETYPQKNQLLLNLGARFRDASARAGGGLQVAKVSRGLAIGDLDDDGDPDVVVSNMDDTPTLLENRQQTGHHWIAVRAVSPTTNRFAIGAKVTVESAGTKQLREIRSGGS